MTGYMRKLAGVFLFGVLANLSGFAQSNTTAGLAGVGAGTALGAATGQGATTPSSATGGGGGSAPIEIQIMAFNGLRRIARDVASITQARGSCVPSVDPNAEYEKLRQDIEKSGRDSAIPGQVPAGLGKDLMAVSEDLQALDEMTADQEATYKSLRVDIKKSGEDASNSADASILGKDISTLVSDLNAIDQEKKNTCAVLIEDPTSANQVGLYQAVEGYYGHLKLLQADLSDYFTLHVDPPMASFSTAPSQKVRLTNVSANPITITGVGITGDGFSIPPLSDGSLADCNGRTLNPGDYCEITVAFSGKPPKEESQTLTGQLHIPNGKTGTEQTVQLTGTVAAATKEEQQKKEKEQKEFEEKFGKLSRQYFGKTYVFNPEAGSGGLGAAASTTPPPATTTGSGGAATAPVSLTYLSDIMTALGGIKSAVTYAPSSTQPTTQAFEVLVEAELSNLKPPIMSYTSTSVLNLREAKNALTGQFGQMLAWGSQIGDWTSKCKPAAGNPTTSDAAKPNTAPTNTACADSRVTVNLAVATQMITGYTTLLSAPNDSGGNPAIVDVLRGKVLSDLMAGGIPSLQLAVAAAGGSTKTNSYFGLNLFYQFAPSYNAGVIATFELRDKYNVLLESGARNVLFNYTKWKSKDFHYGELKSSDGTCSFCSED